jgi:hypothetical protein
MLNGMVLVAVLWSTLRLSWDLPGGIEENYETPESG